ncbi:hypothetical protein ACT29H_08825 [Thermophagus sp. OGC60D27]|uniref:hypothetical protein n=1 Tax=Thermophagus sp. OGC60D27 TaxID=3458415 RepID=UPI004037A9EB
MNFPEGSSDHDLFVGQEKRIFGTLISIIQRLKNRSRHSPDTRWIPFPATEQPGSSNRFSEKYEGFIFYR